MTNPSGRLRIIGGCWRGRKLPVPDVEGVRPTPDRVRETLFNWLAPVIAKANCLDLFAGSGALGLEAISRGAAQVVLVDNHPQVIRQLQDNLKLLGAENQRVSHTDVSAFLSGKATETFDIVFLDPPYADNRLTDCLQQLQENNWLKPQARIYIEYARRGSEPELPDQWKLLRQKTAGQVRYGLLTLI